jgi:hypothetical protein
MQAEIGDCLHCVNCRSSPEKAQNEGLVSWLLNKPKTSFQVIGGSCRRVGAKLGDAKRGLQCRFSRSDWSVVHMPPTDDKRSHLVFIKPFEDDHYSIHSTDHAWLNIGLARRKSWSAAPAVFGLLMLFPSGACWSWNTNDLE